MFSLLVSLLIADAAGSPAEQWVAGRHGSKSQGHEYSRPHTTTTQHAGKRHACLNIMFAHCMEDPIPLLRPFRGATTFKRRAHLPRISRKVFTRKTFWQSTQFTLQGHGSSMQGGVGKQLWNGGSPYNPSELSGWGSNLNSAYPPPNLDTAALLSAQVLFHL